MKDPFVLQPLGTRSRWALHPPTDPYGDGYVWVVRSEISDEGMTAETSAKLAGCWGPEDETDLARFFQCLADDFRGWESVREWHSLEREMKIDARHDGRGRVTIGVTLRRARQAYSDDAWSARAVFTREAGEEMSRLASDIRDLLSG